MPTPEILNAGNQTFPSQACVIPQHVLGGHPVATGNPAGHGGRQIIEQKLLQRLRLFQAVLRDAGDHDGILCGRVKGKIDGSQALQKGLTGPRGQRSQKHQQEGLLRTADRRLRFGNDRQLRERNVLKSRAGPAPIHCRFARFRASVAGRIVVKSWFAAVKTQVAGWARVCMIFSGFVFAKRGLFPEKQRHFSGERPEARQSECQSQIGGEKSAEQISQDPHNQGI